MVGVKEDETQNTLTVPPPNVNRQGGVDECDMFEQFRRQLLTGRIPHLLAFVSIERGGNVVRKDSKVGVGQPCFTGEAEGTTKNARRKARRGPDFHSQA